MHLSIQDVVSTADRHVKLTTAQLAARLCVEAQTIRAGLCRKGNYLGMRPAVKLPNGRLLWDSDELQSILAGELAK